MKIIEKYQTRDGQVHNSKTQAQSHALAQAQILLRDILLDCVPHVENGGAIATQIILKLSKNPAMADKVGYIAAWLNDAEVITDD